MKRFWFDTFCLGNLYAVFGNPTVSCRNYFMLKSDKRNPELILKGSTFFGLLRKQKFFPIFFARSCKLFLADKEKSVT